MAERQQNRPPQASSSQTQTQPQTEEKKEDPSKSPPLVLKLRGAHQAQSSISWDESVIDNEGLGRKSSKGWHNILIQVCCIYRKPKGFDESSSDESSSCDEDEPNAYEKVKE
jgi:protein phosphatase 1 regulatory subunit 11